VWAAQHEYQHGIYSPKHVQTPSASSSVLPFVLECSRWHYRWNIGRSCVHEFVCSLCLCEIHFGSFGTINTNTVRNRKGNTPAYNENGAVIVGRVHAAFLGVPTDRVPKRAAIAYGVACVVSHISTCIYVIAETSSARLSVECGQWTWPVGRWCRNAVKLWLHTFLLGCNLTNVSNLLVVDSWLSLEG
jgi:hypothetical protein